LSVLAAGCPRLPEPNFSPTEPNITIVTYNVNYGFVHPKNVIDFLIAADADIVFLQETHIYWEAALEEALAGAYPYAAFEDWDGAGGIAILSKHSLENIKFVKPTAGWFPALRADAQTPIGTIQLLNVHLKPPVSDSGSVSVSAYYEAPEIHLQEISDFLTTTDPNKPLIVAGDFNENEKNRAIRWLLDQGFTDALSTYDKRSKTWIWRTSGGLTLTNRYDHIIVNDHLHCAGAAVIPVKASDHMPVLAVIVPAQTDRQ
jgi:endonuclease/exonuclease/phosphatase family metal-dependent hydrolase